MKDARKTVINLTFGVLLLVLLVWSLYFIYLHVKESNQEENYQITETQKAEEDHKSYESTSTNIDIPTNERTLPNNQGDDEQEEETAQSDVDFSLEEKHYLENIEKENGLVTLEYLEELSWSEIRDNADELFGERTVHFDESEDAFLRFIVYKLESTLETLNDNDYNEGDYISFGGPIPLKHIDYETFCKKIQAIINENNQANDIKAICYTKKCEDRTVRCEMYSYNYPVTYIGQVAKIKWGPSFYETSKEFGSGRRDSTIYCENYGFAQHPYIPEDDLVIVNGVSYLTEEGKIGSSEYYTYDQIKEQHISIPIDTDKEHMLHICTEE